MILWLLVPALLSAAAWVYLLLFNGRFWLCSERLPSRAAAASAPPVAVVIPARNEADTIATTVRSLVEQRDARPVAIVVTDDGSDDGTAAVARSAADGDQLILVEGRPLPAGWSGKLWAQQQAIDVVEQRFPESAYLLLSDADIGHGPATLADMVAKAERDNLDMVSLMVRLNCESAWERLLIPPFVFFFQKLYPFPRANDPASSVAAAAGGCVLLRRSALARIGGLEAMRNALIDDCTLARAVKRSGGRIWVGLADDSRSLRRYDRLQPIWNMVARSAYTQLKHSPLLLLGTVLGMLLLYLAPPAILLSAPWHGDFAAAAAAALAWLLMSIAFWPTVRYYRQPAWIALTLPAAALLYTAMTVDSALRHWRGRGGQWKGRRYSNLADARS